jgi:hypothetical protein
MELFSGEINGIMDEPTHLALQKLSRLAGNSVAADSGDAVMQVRMARERAIEAQHRHSPPFPSRSARDTAVNTHLPSLEAYEQMALQVLQSPSSTPKQGQLPSGALVSLRVLAHEELCKVFAVRFSRDSDVYSIAKAHACRFQPYETAWHIAR